MPSPPTLDVEALLTPVADEHPAGESLRYAGTYDAIEDARRADDDLSQGEWVRDTKTADWSTVIEIASEALATKSKDLQIAVWLVEALVKRYGFAGLRDGLQLLWGVQERFWESFYPEVEDDDLEFRAAPLVWLNDKLPLSLRQIPVTRSPSGETYSWLHWEESRMVDNLGRGDQAAMQAALAEGKITGEQFDKAVEATPLAYHQTLFEDLRQSREACDKLTQLVDNKFGRDALSLLGIKKVLDDCHTLLEGILKRRGGLEPEPTPPQPEPEPERDLLGHILRGRETSTSAEVELATARPVPNYPASGLSLEPQDRADALRRLAAVAAYFRRTEPHSPVSYLVQRAVRWAEMPLEDWLRYVIHDETALENVRETLGLKDADHSGSQESGD
jgi:type VI secretion system protein ImpA